MMKIVIAGDNHGDREAIERIVNSNPDATLFLHVGDSQMASYEIAPFISVKGNNDFGYDYPRELTFKTPYGDLFICHGNFTFGITPQIVKMKNCKIFVYGHVHRKRIQKFEDVYVVSPGSTSLPRDGKEGSYLVVEFDEMKNPLFTFKTL